MIVLVFTQLRGPPPVPRVGPRLGKIPNWEGPATLAAPVDGKAALAAAMDARASLTQPPNPK